MRITCLSCSNIKPFRDRSASTRTCQMIGELVQATRPGVEVEIVRLVDHRLKPCTMCGGCFRSGHCRHDPAFNTVLDRMAASDALFWVVPHYAPFPSKVMMLLEKMEEQVFLRGCTNPDFRFALWQKPVGIVAHGGMKDQEDGGTHQALDYYKAALVEPLAAALGAVQMRVIGAGEAWPHGVAFGVQDIAMPRGDAIFCTITHDWELIRARVAPLVANVVAALG